ncbi:MAG: immune inhibitor A domain-containing protein [Gaiellaceae bacterium]
MRKSLYALAAACAVAVAAVPSALAAPDPGKAWGMDAAGAHDLPNPLADKQRALRAKGLQMQIEGRIPENASVARVADDQFVELEREGEDSIWTVIGEFGAGVATHSHGTHAGPAGPLHNEIAEPDRSVDNTTIWKEDFSEAHYEELLFSEEPGAVSMRNYYIEQSSNRYAVNGDVTDWVQVPNNAASYGSNYCGGIVCQDTWFFVQDSVDAWYQNQIAAGKTPAEIEESLSRFDVWDRYDHDGDGDFDEADGYIDHFQSVHAGMGEETDGGAQGSDAIWSHRWYVQLTPIGAGGPTLDDGTQVPFGGTQIGDSKYWIGDYTIEPENGGVGVFAHEFAHDLDIPDLYDTSGNTGGAENSTAFWTLMSSGSYGSSGEPEDGIGSAPMHLGNWEKFQLGWLNYDVAEAGKRSWHTLGPAEYNSTNAQGLFVLLPDKQVTVELGEPYEGERYYYSESGDNLDNFMTKTVTLPAGANLTAKARYDIEIDWDYAYVVVSTDGGSTWTGVETNLSTDENPNGQNFGNGITGDSGGQWVDLTADLSGYTGDVLLGFRYWTDGATVEPGFQVDAISIAGGPIDGAETDAGWTFDGFRTTTGTETTPFFNAYVAENRQYIGYDDSLRTSPYNFGFLSTRPDWVEHFSYQDGLLVSYWDSSYTDNSVGDHPGAGLILPVDAHPEIEYWSDGTMMRPRLQSYDSTFGVHRTESYTLHNDGVPTTIESKPAVRVFDDRKSYWTGGSAPGHYQPGWSSVQVPNTGTQIRVKSLKRSGIARIQVRPVD